MTNYISHMRATFYDGIIEQPIYFSEKDGDGNDVEYTVDGQHIGIHGYELICDGVVYAQYDLIKKRWWLTDCEVDAMYADRIVFTYVDADQNTLPDN